MKIFLVDKNKKYTNDFFDFLKFKFLDVYYQKVNIEKLLPFEDFVNEVSRYKSILKKHISITEVCQIAFQNIIVLRFGNNITIKINEKVLLPNTNVKLIELCKLINNGNLDLKAYPIFTEIFNDVKDNLEKYYSEYALEVK